MQTLKDSYTIKPARYAKGKMAIHCKPDGSGWKTLAALIVSAMPGVRYSGRESSYIVSPRCATKFEQEVEKIQQERDGSQ